jgi:hypothetical protein
LPRKREIEAAIAAHNDTDPEALLPPAAARLLITMFPRRDVCQRSLDDLARAGFDRRGVVRLLHALIEAGFLSKERGQGLRAPNIYRLHLPPVRR